ncbi:MAG: carbohydrate ABC transporter permease [Lachnospiraceae bacterium]|nr:carbohydrate ABC transporter permease [Lachnospiraceae bacterium]
MEEDKKRLRFIRPIRIAICIVLCLLSLFPFYILFINATNASSRIMQGLVLIPGSSLISNYTGLLKRSTDAQIVTIWKAMFNSLIVTVPTTVLQVYFASFTAYGITVYRFKGREVAWAFIYAIMMIPTQVSIVGLIKVCQVTGLYGSRLALILPAIAAPTTVYFMKQYMEASFSVEIVEAARIDGAGEIRTFNTIALPLLKPGMATQAIFAFVASWNNLYTPSILLATNRDKATMPMFIEALKSNDKQRDFGQIYLGLAMSVLPIMIAYFVLSKYIVAGVSLGGVKE